ncbi:MAG: DUF3078 domain-containing protein [Chitinophagaceae bacterium]|jgi:hypothetical protein|nr:DUF3078 domain-containing protein [Chitinophagaceae bacterium]
MKTRISFALLLLVYTGMAQDARKQIDQLTTNKAVAADTSKKAPWKFGGTFALAISQQNNSYWVGVTEKFALSLGASVDLYANYAGKRNSWDNTLKASYAYLNNQSQGLRKTADFFDLFSKYGHALNPEKTLSISGIFNLRSQFTNGYDYESNPRRRTSGFFAPAYMLLTPGLDWRPNKHFSLFFSPVAARLVIISGDPFSYSTNPPPAGEKPLASLYGVDPERKLDAQFGAFLSGNFNKEILKNVNYSSRIDLYSNYLNKPENIDLFWTNSIVFKVNKWLTLSYLLNLAYDNDIQPAGLNGPRLQYLGTFGLGASAKF